MCHSREQLSSPRSILGGLLGVRQRVSESVSVLQNPWLGVRSLACSATAAARPRCPALKPAPPPARPSPACRRPQRRQHLQQRAQVPGVRVGTQGRGGGGGGGGGRAPRKTVAPAEREHGVCVWGGGHCLSTTEREHGICVWGGWHCLSTAPACIGSPPFFPRTPSDGDGPAGWPTCPYRVAPVNLVWQACLPQEPDAPPPRHGSRTKVST